MNNLNKTCKTCSLLKPISEFNSNDKSKNTYKSSCKTCCINYNRKYRAEHKRPVRTKEESHKHYMNIKNDKARLDRRSELETARRKLPEYRYKLYAKNAKRTNRTFDISYLDFMKFWQMPCYYCGDNIDLVGLDRVTNTDGYVLDNLVSCCESCNKSKNKLSLPDFLSRIEVIYSFVVLGIRAINCKTFKSAPSNKHIYHSSVRAKLATYKRSAAERQITFNISDVEFLSFWNKECHYCGDQIETIGLDRSDNDIGYELSNIVSCCKDCNFIKFTLGYDDFIIKVTKIYTRHIANN